MRLMDDAILATQFKNLDLRLACVEQILPTLATKDDLKVVATKDELKALATKEELKELEVTLRREIREEGDRSRRHMEIISEAQRDDIRLLAEDLSVVMSKLEDR
jgi:hypothetical protein